MLSTLYIGETGHVLHTQSSNTYKAQNVVVNLALWIASKSLIPPLLNFNLNLIKEAMQIVTNVQQDL